jgi:putative FmdB family regulatory protein
MPIYEFVCNQCGKIFEELIFPSDPQTGFLCPSCGDSDTCKLMSSFSCGQATSGGGSSKSACSPSSGGFS